MLAACGDDGVQTPGSVVSADSAAVVASKSDAVSVAQNEPALSLLVEAVTRAGLADALSGPGPLTVLAPTNDAFVALLAELGLSKDQLFADKTLLDAVLRYHVLPVSVSRADIVPGAPVESLQGSVFTVAEAAGGELFVNDGRGRQARITATDIPADNAVIHLLDKVILPPDQTVIGVAQTQPGFATLVKAVEAAGLVDALSGAGPFTVFAPTDDAFAALLDALGISADQLLADTSLLGEVLRYHVVPGLVTKARVPLGEPVVTLQGGAFTVDTSLTITDAQHRAARIVATDILATNGVVHVIDSVLLPPSIGLPAPAPGLVDIAVADPRFSLLVEAVTIAGLADTLSGPGPFTVFAPTDHAFQALLHELHLSKEQLFADVHALRDVLLYHVIGARVPAAEVPIGTHIGTLQGGAISIDAHLRIADARHRQSAIIATDVFGSNGVIHVIDRVLLPH
ncbi:MAG: fasciclin domain-containing protein [Burkholderiaceae bacterium]